MAWCRTRRLRCALARYRAGSSDAGPCWVHHRLCRLRPPIPTAAWPLGRRWSSSRSCSWRRSRRNRAKRTRRSSSRCAPASSHARRLWQDAPGFRRARVGTGAAGRRQRAGARLPEGRAPEAAWATWPFRLRRSLRCFPPPMRLRARASGAPVAHHRTLGTQPLACVSRAARMAAPVPPSAAAAAMPAQQAPLICPGHSRPAAPWPGVGLASRGHAAKSTEVLFAPLHPTQAGEDVSVGVGLVGEGGQDVEGARHG